MILVSMEIYSDLNQRVLTPKQTMNVIIGHPHHVALASCSFPTEGPGKFVGVKGQTNTAKHSEEGGAAWKYCFRVEHSAEANR